MDKQPPEGFAPLDPDRQSFGEAESWYQLVGPLYRAAERDPGHVSLAFFSEHRHVNYLKQVHGGMMMAFMDYVLWNTACSVWDSSSVVTISMSIDFVAPSPVDNWIIGDGELIRAGSTVAFVRGAARAGDNIIVHATGTYRKIGSK